MPHNSRESPPRMATTVATNSAGATRLERVTRKPSKGPEFHYSQAPGHGPHSTLPARSAKEDRGAGGRGRPPRSSSPRLRAPLSRSSVPLTLRPRAPLNDRVSHEPEPRPARLAPVLHLDQPADGGDVAHGRDPLARAGGTPAGADLKQLPCPGGLRGGLLPPRPWTSPRWHRAALRRAYAHTRRGFSGRKVRMKIDRSRSGEASARQGSWCRTSCLSSEPHHRRSRRRQRGRRSP